MADTGSNSGSLALENHALNLVNDYKLRPMLSSGGRQIDLGFLRDATVELSPKGN